CDWSADVRSSDRPKLRGGIVGVCRKREPAGGGGFVLGDALAVEEEDYVFHLCADVPVPRRPAAPATRHLVVAHQAPALDIESSERVLRIHVAISGGAPEI